MDNLDKLDFLYKEIAYAESKLQPHDTGHISTAISWMQQRVRETQEEIRNANVHREGHKNSGYMGRNMLME
jgi:hypothetical protein